MASKGPQTVEWSKQAMNCPVLRNWILQGDTYIVHRMRSATATAEGLCLSWFAMVSGRNRRLQTVLVLDG